MNFNGHLFVFLNPALKKHSGITWREGFGVLDIYKSGQHEMNAQKGLNCCSNSIKKKTLGILCALKAVLLEILSILGKG